MPALHLALSRARAFCDTFDIRLPILMAPMAGACPPALAVAVANAGGMGACGALLMPPEAIGEWTRTVRAETNGAFQLNLWVRAPAPARDPEHEAAIRQFLEGWGPPVPPEAGDMPLPDFEAQCEAMLAAGPAVISSIMGLYPPEVVARMKAQGIKWFATVTTVAEALAAEAAGADVLVVQGMEAGGHRGAFEPGQAATNAIGLFSLLPAVVDATRLPVIATGGIADGRGVAAALILGASAVQIGTALLRAPEAGISPVWADALGRAKPEETVLTRAFSGRLGRSVRNAYTTAAAGPDAPEPAPYPVQGGLTLAMRTQAAKEGNLDAMQAWAGQSAAMAVAAPAADIVADLWESAERHLSQ